MPFTVLLSVHWQKADRQKHCFYAIIEFPQRFIYLNQRFEIYNIKYIQHRQFPPHPFLHCKSPASFPSVRRCTTRSHWRQFPALGQVNRLQKVKKPGQPSTYSASLLSQLEDRLEGRHFEYHMFSPSPPFFQTTSLEQGTGPPAWAHDYKDCTRFYVTPVNFLQSSIHIFSNKKSSINQ